MVCNRTWVEKIFSRFITHITGLCVIFMYFAAEAWNPAMDSQHKFQRELLWSEQKCSVKNVDSYIISGLNFVCTVFVHTWIILKRLTLHYICFCNKIPSNMYICCCLTKEIFFWTPNYILMDFQKNLTVSPNPCRLTAIQADYLTSTLQTIGFLEIVWKVRNLRSETTAASV